MTYCLNNTVFRLIEGRVRSREGLSKGNRSHDNQERVNLRVKEALARVRALLFFLLSWSIHIIV